MNEEPTAPLTDVYGRRVPQRLAGPFQFRNTINDWFAELAALERKLLAWAAKDPHGVFTELPIEVAQQQMRALKNNIGRYLPAIPCDCGPDQDCKLCNNKRWLSAFNILGISAGQKRRMLARALEAPWPTSPPLSPTETANDSAASPSPSPENCSPSLAEET